MKKLFSTLTVFIALALASAGAFAAAVPIALKTFAAGCTDKIGAHIFVFMARAGLILCAGDVPTPEDFDNYRVTNPNQSEVIRQRFYDYQLYVTAGAQQLTFFSQAVGQGLTTALGAAAGTPKTYWDTNLDMPSTLPTGKVFMIESIEVDFQPGSVSTANTYTPAALQAFAVAAASTVGNAVTDVNNFYLSGMLELNVLSKNQLRETPLKSFPPKAGMDLSAAVASNSATVGETTFGLAKATGRPYYLQPRISLFPGANFEVLLKWPGAVATPSGFNGRVGVIMDGYFMRSSQ